jgi:DNA-binding response OmpR family regulator
MDKKIILMVEDDKGIMLSNKKFLEMKGYGILTAETLREAENILEHNAPDLILLDINLPDGSGMDFITRMRETALCFAPVIFLTARTCSLDIIEGLNLGGKDYITKPYDLGILAARVETQLRNAQMSMDIMKRGPLTLHVIAQLAELDGEDMLLAKKEFALLLLLVRNEGKTLTKEYLYEKVWGQQILNDSNAFYTQMNRLKTKMKQHGNIELFVSRDEGYCLNILE